MQGMEETGDGPGGNGGETRMLHESAAEQLRELIIEGTLPPGTRLNERVLCEQLGVSRTPLREAIRTLAGEGMIRLMPNRGAEVARLSRADVEEAFELMGALESLNGQLAAARATEVEIDEIRALNFEMQAAHARRDLSTYYRLNRAIHDHFAACARNRLLADTYARINRRLQALRFQSNLNREKWDDAMAEHAEMVEALATRDGARLGAILHRHLERKRAIVLEQLGEDGHLEVPGHLRPKLSPEEGDPAGT